MRGRLTNEFTNFDEIDPGNQGFCGFYTRFFEHTHQRNAHKHIYK